MTRMLLVAVALTVLAPAPAVLLAPVAAAAAGAAVWLFADCVRWPAVTHTPALWSGRFR